MALPYGKVPSEILESIVFPNLGFKNKDVILGPSRGEDAAIIKVKEGVIVASCDPISGAVESAGWLAINVSANDVATRGVRPRWCLICILLPKDFSRESMTKICGQMNRAAKKLKIAIAGGHSETSPGLNHPIIISFCIGSAKRGRYLKTADARPGSRLVLTKGVGIEGTGILATDKRGAVEKAFGAGFADRSARYLDEISVIPEAMIAARMKGVYALHDPTEGGVLGGLWEMADASRCGFKVYERNLIIRPETEAICRLFSIDPLRLISSGSLLISVDRRVSASLVSALRRIRIPASIIGEMTDDVDQRALVTKEGCEKGLQMPETDELWKVLDRL
ncbi:MAG: AIR synthase family protein [Candidatus Bathyarchaeia archaeon]